MSVHVQRPGRVRHWGIVERTQAALQRHITLFVLVWGVVLACLVGTDYWCLRLTRLPIQLQLAGTSVKIIADGQSLTAALPTIPTDITFVSGSQLLREYQVDGTDNTNNFTETPAGVEALQGNPYYTFLNWMRSSSLYSDWVGLHVTDGVGRTTLSRETVSSGHEYALPNTGTVWITVALERPEAPASLALMGSSGQLAQVTVDRNDRLLSLDVYSSNGATSTYQAPYFPTQPLPYLAEVVDTALRVLIWALALAGIEVLLALAIVALAHESAFYTARLLVGSTTADVPGRVRGRALRLGIRSRVWRVPLEAQSLGLGVAGHLRDGAAGRLWAAAQRVSRYDVMAACLATCSLAFGIVVALVQFQGEPHILDASAYFFQAKIFASGQLSVPAPTDLTAFQGPFMVAWHGRWFAQYPPATSALLAIGILIHAPWLIEPALGTAALVGVYAIGRQLYGPRTGLAALALLALSPFYEYQSASYLSHTVALAAEVGYLTALLWFVRSHRVAALALAGAALGVMFNARELDAVLVGIMTTLWIACGNWRALAADWRRVLVCAVVGAATLGCGLALYLAYNALQTGSPLLLPRVLFSPADRYGFGAGVGFYGRHTVAAGLVNLDEQLTSLMIDLFGWPFYVTLALVPLAFIRRDGRTAWDAMWLAIAGVIVVAQIGYFYHGIYMGPRYLFDTLPALALLSARGLGKLASVGGTALERAGFGSGGKARIRYGQTAAALLLTGLVACSMSFYWPRQWALYSDFSGLPANMQIDVSAVYHAHLDSALVITESWYVYNYVLWPLNDPALKGNVIYAYASSADDLSRLREEYPQRQMYLLTSDSQGRTQFLLVPR